jgi:hypothetical protein
MGNKELTASEIKKKSDDELREKLMNSYHSSPETPIKKLTDTPSMVLRRGDILSRKLNGSVSGIL